MEVQDANSFTDELSGRITQYYKEVSELSSTVSVVCRLKSCPSSFKSTVEQLETLRSELASLSETIQEAQELQCPSTSCINLDLLWFLDASGCVCASERISSIRGNAGVGAHRPKNPPRRCSDADVDLPGTQHR
jgi:hypothetical protein